MIYSKEEGKDQESFQSKTHLFKETRYRRNIDGLGVSSVESVVESYMLVIQHTFKARGTSTHSQQAGRGLGYRKSYINIILRAAYPRALTGGLFNSMIATESCTR